MSDNKKIPNIRFSGFADDWEQCKLNDISEIIGGGTPSTNNPDYWDGDIDWYAPAEMEGQIYATGSIRKITEIGLQNSSAKVLPAHRTVLFTSRAGIGKMAILQRPGATNQGFQSMVLKDEYNPYFVYSMGSVIKEKAEGIASGSTFLEISGKMLGNLEIMVPNKTEQDAIAKYFESVDNLITLHQRKYDKLLLVKKSMLEKIFPKEGEVVPEIRFSGFTESWERYKVTELGKIYIGLVTTMTKNYTSEGTLLIRNSDIKDGFFKFGENPIYLDSVFAEKNKSRMHQLGDVITVHTGDVGTSAVITENTVNSIGFATIVTRPNQEVIDSRYFATFLNTDKHKKWAVSVSTGDGRTNYNLGDYNELVVPVPEVEEQKKIATYIQNMNNLITLHQRKLEKLKIIKKSMLDKMLV